jgi:hypothetical protein
MKRRAVRWILGVLVVGVAACGDGEEPAAGGGVDTLEIEVPDAEVVEDRLQEGARRIGGRVGEALEETGEAIERAGERIQEEAVEADTVGP